MSNHNLFTLSAEGAAVPASSEAILVAARQVLAHRVRRGATLQSPQKTGEYLMARLGHLDYEVFGLILLDKRHRIIECIDLFRGTIDGACVTPDGHIKARFAPVGETVADLLEKLAFRRHRRLVAGSRQPTRG